MLYFLLCIADLLIVARMRGVEWVDDGDECEEGMRGVVEVRVGLGGEKVVGMEFVRWVE